MRVTPPYVIKGGARKINNEKRGEFRLKVPQTPRGKGLVRREKTPYFKFPRHTTSSTNRGEGVMGRGYTSNKKNLDFTVL